MSNFISEQKLNFLPKTILRANAISQNSIGEIQFFGGHTLIGGDVYFSKSLTSSSIRGSNRPIEFLSKGDFQVEAHYEDQVMAMIIGDFS